jgi:two-component system CheB/CheR fusion protein
MSVAGRLKLNALAESPSLEPEKPAWFYEIVALVDTPALVLDHAHRILFANHPFCSVYRTPRESLVGRHLREVASGGLYTLEVRETLAAVQSDAMSEGSRAKRVGLPLAGERMIGSNVWSLPAPFHPASVLLLLDMPAEWTMAHKGRPAPGLGVPPDPLAALSSEALRHDIRQPLQTLSLLQGVLAARSDGSLRTYVARLRETIEALGGMLDVLEDLEYPIASKSVPRLVGFSIETVLNRLRSEFSYHAEAKGIELKVVPSRAVVYSDAHCLERLVRVLLLVAVKMIRHGKLLFGCRRRRHSIMLQIWASGEMIEPGQQQSILDEFHHGVAYSKELGIVHSIVKPLSGLLGLSVKARSQAGSGLLFTADLRQNRISQLHRVTEAALGSPSSETAAPGVVAAFTDNSLDHEPLKLVLEQAGYRVVAVRYDAGQVKLDSGAGMLPEVIVAEFALLADDAAARVIEKMRTAMGPHTPIIVITNESSAELQSSPDRDPVTYLSRPASPEEITALVSQSLAAARTRFITPRTRNRRSSNQTTFIVDDDHLLLDAMSALLKVRDERTEVYSSAEGFLKSYATSRRGCLVVDDKLPGLGGVELLEELKDKGAMLPGIVITGHGDIAGAVRAMRAGAIDYIEKPVSAGQLLSAIERALEIDRELADKLARRQELRARYATLTEREREVLEHVANGASSKVIGRMLKISQRTVENHRSRVMKRMGANSLSDLIQAVLELRST